MTDIRQRADHQAGSNHQHKAQHGPVYGDVAYAREMIGAQPHQPTDAQPSERETGDGSQPGQDKSLSKKSPENAMLRRAQRRAQSDLPPSVAGARQQQVGDV